jgi:hypothetical protein
MDIDEIFNNTETATKLDFLRNLLVRNEAVRNQFVEFCKGNNEPPNPESVENSSEETIAGVFEDLKKKLESLDFNDLDWRGYVPRHSGYIEDYEAAEHMAEDQLTEIFDAFTTTVRGYIRNGNLHKAVCYLVGAYEACNTADIPGGDDVLGDLTNSLMDMLKQMLTSLMPDISASVLTNDQILSSFVVIFSHYKKSPEQDDGILRTFQLFLISLINTKDVAECVYSAMADNGIDDSCLSALTVRIFSFNEDPGEWVMKAEQFMYDDLNIAQQALSYFWINAPDLFLAHARKLFALHPYVFHDFLNKHLFPEFDRELFVQVKRYVAIHQKSIEVYQELRDYLDDAAKEQFIKEILWDKLFLVQVLEQEQRFGDILSLLKKKDNSVIDFHKLVKPILNIYPKEVFELIGAMISDTLRNNKSRSYYECICRLLALAVQIKGMENEAHELILSLYNRRPALPALKDEMRKLGVVRGK